MGHVRYLPNKLPAKSLYQQMFISGCLHINEHSISCRCWLSNTKYFFSQYISNGWRNRWKERYFIENVSSVVAKCQNEQKNNSEKAWDVFLGLSKLHRRWRNNFSQIPRITQEERHFLPIAHHRVACMSFEINILTLLYGWKEINYFEIGFNFHFVFYKKNAIVG